MFGIIGYVLIRLGCEPAPLLLGFVLGPLLEEHLRRAMILYRGDPMIFLEHPISANLLALAALAIVVAFFPPFENGATRSSSRRTDSDGPGTQLGRRNSET
jgi:TctA family transporter